MSKFKVSGINAKAKENLDQRARMLGNAALYWPDEAIPTGYAVACIEIVLLHDEQASSIYNEAIKALDLTDCQKLLDIAKSNVSDTHSWMQNAWNVKYKGNPKMALPSIWSTTHEEYKDNSDFKAYIGLISDFIHVGFNSRQDHRYKTWKVTPEHYPPYLLSVAINRTIAVHFKAKLEYFGKYRPVIFKGREYDIDSIMREKPTTGTERDLYRGMTSAFKRLRWTLVHDEKILKDADQWYKCRVNPGNIEIYLDNLAKEGIYSDRGRIENDVAICDLTTGYPRKWRNHT